MTKITVWGGAGEIGGSMVFTEDKPEDKEQETVVSFDVGAPLDRINEAFLGLLQMRKFNVIKDLMYLKIIPNIKGIYRKDYLKHMGLEEYIGKFLDGILLSHAHLDHSGWLPFMDWNIPTWMSKATKYVLQAFEEIGGNPFYEFLHPHHSFERGLTTDGKREKIVTGEKVKRKRNIHTFVPNKRFKINGLEVEAFDVSHSLPANAFALNTSSGVVLYVGDIGAGEDTERFIEAAAKLDPLLMISEGTRINEEHIKTEEDVYSEALDVVNNTEKLVIVSYAVRNVPRIKTYHRIAQETGRVLVIDSRQAFLLKLFKGKYGLPKLSDENIGIYLSRKGRGLIDREGWPEYLVKTDYFDWEKKYVSHDKRILLEEIISYPGEFIFFMDFFSSNDLFDLKPPKGSSYIKSTTKPFNKLMELEEEVLLRRLRWFGFDSDSIHTIHTSGHLDGRGLERMINTIGPRWLMLIHTKYPEMAEEIYNKDKIIPVERGKPVIVNENQWYYEM